MKTFLPGTLLIRHNPGSVPSELLLILAHVEQRVVLYSPQHGVSKDVSEFIQLGYWSFLVDVECVSS